MRRLRVRLARLDRGLSAVAALALVLYLVFLIVPVLLSLKTSFTNQNILFPGSSFVGLANYRAMLHDSQLRASIGFTLTLAVAVTIAANVVGLSFAVLLNRTSLSYRVLRTLAFLPQVISGIIAGFVWSWMLSPAGLVNHILAAVGLISQPVNWLGTPQLAMLSAGAVVSWVLSGFTTVVYLAALQNIPRELYDASSIDGANSRQQFRMITFRMVAPATTISVVICLITVLKLYDIITALTGGGPAYSTRSIAMYIISVGFSNDAYGYASAIAMVLLLLTAIIALSVTTVLRRREIDLWIAQRTAPSRPAPGRNAASRAARRTPRAVRRSARLALALLVILAFVSPIYLTIVNAFKTNAAIASSPQSLPTHPTLSNLSAALSQPGHVLEIGLRNSLIVVVCSVVLLIPLGSAFSFWISRKRTRTRAAIMAAFAAGLMIPPQITVLPIIKILTLIGLDHSYPGLILSNIGGGYLSFAVFVYVGFMRSIPAEVIEAARIDGATGLRIWWKIIMPLVRPATATVGIFLSLWIWNDFLNPLLIIGPITGQTVTVGLYDSVSNQIQPDYGLQFGFMFLAAIIPVAGYLLAQKQFRAGLTAGSAR